MIVQSASLFILVILSTIQSWKGGGFVLKKSNTQGKTQKQDTRLLAVVTQQLVTSATGLEL